MSRTGGGFGDGDDANAHAQGVSLLGAVPSSHTVPVAASTSGGGRGNTASGAVSYAFGTDPYKSSHKYGATEGVTKDGLAGPGGGSGGAPHAFKRSTQEEAARLEAALKGTPLRSHWLFATVRGRMVGAFMALLASVVASGPVITFPSLEPMMGPSAAHVDLTDVYNVGSGISMASVFIVGMAYDAYGARAVGGMGGLVASAGLCLMSLAVHEPETLSWLLYVAYPLAYTGGLMSSFSLYAYLWLFASHKALFASLANGSQMASDTAPYFIGQLNQNNGVSLAACLLVLGIASAVAAVVIVVFVPDHSIEQVAIGIAAQGGDRDAQASVMAREETQTMHYNGNSGGGGGDGGCGERATSGVKALWFELKAVLRGVAQFPVANALFAAWAISAWLWLMYMTSVSYYYLMTMFGPQVADTFENKFALTYGLAGFVFSCVLGWACDKMGLRAFFAMVNAALLLYLVTTMVAHVPVQWVAAVTMTLCISGFLLLLPRFALAYTSTRLFGSLFGLLLSVSGLMQLIIVTPAINAAMELPGLQPYHTPHLALGSITLTLSLCMMGYWCRHPPPEVGAVKVVAS